MYLLDELLLPLHIKVYKSEFSKTFFCNFTDFSSTVNCFPQFEIYNANLLIFYVMHKSFLLDICDFLNATEIIIYLMTSVTTRQNIDNHLHKHVASVL